MTNTKPGVTFRKALTTAVAHQLTKRKRKGKGGAKRNEIQRLEDIEQAVELRRRGKTYVEIAKLISQKRGITLSHVTIIKDVELAKKEWTEECQRERKSRVAEQVAHHRSIIKGLYERRELAAQEFERSKLNAVTEKAEGTPAADPTAPPIATKVTKTIKGQCGDVSYLAEMRQIDAEIRANLQEIAKLQHLYPKSIEEAEGAVQKPRVVTITFGDEDVPVAPWRTEPMPTNVIDVTPKQLEASTPSPASELTGAAAANADFQEQMHINSEAR